MPWKPTGMSPLGTEVHVPPGHLPGHSVPCGARILSPLPPRPQSLPLGTCMLALFLCWSSGFCSIHSAPSVLCLEKQPRQAGFLVAAAGRGVVGAGREEGTMVAEVVARRARLGGCAGEVTPLKALTTGQTGSQCLAWKALREEAPLKSPDPQRGGRGGCRWCPAELCVSGVQRGGPGDPLPLQAV